MDSDCTIKSLPALSGSTTALLTGPSQNVDYIQWVVDGVIRATTPTTTVPTPYAFTFDTSTCANGYHVVQPVSYVAGYRDFDPAGVSGCVTWIDFSDTSTLFTSSSKTTRVTTNSQTIGAVVDKTGVMPDFTASVGPIFTTNQFNGLPCASFTNSANQILLTSSTLPAAFTGATAGDVFVVARSHSSAIIFGSSSTANSNNCMEFQVQRISSPIYPNFAASFGANGRNIADSSSTMTPDALFVSNFRCTGSTYDFYFNGTHASSYNVITGSNDGLYWFHNLSGAPLNATIGGVILGTGPTSLPQTVLICEVLVYNTSLSSTDRANVEAYLAEKWLPTYAINTADVIASVPTVWSTNDISSVYTGGLLTYTANSETPYAINVDNTDGITMPSIHNHYSHIKTGHLSYQGSINATDLSLFASSIDIGNISIPAVADEIRSASPLTSMLLYLCITKQDWYNTLDWLNYADTNNLNRELAFWHVSAPTSMSLSGWGSGGMPVSWFWDCQAIRGGSPAPCYGTSPTFIISTATNNTGGGGTWLNDGTGVSLGASAGHYITFGYPEKFSDITIQFSTTALGSFAYTLEYPTATNTDGTPSAWAAFTSVTDGTSNATAGGTIHFDPHPSTPWVKCYSIAGGGGLITAGTPNGGMGYYVRLRTTAVGTRTPVMSTCKTVDYCDQGNTPVFTVPIWNSGKLPGDITGFDLDGDGYLNDTEYSNAGSPATTGGHPVRWFYQSRLPTAYGTCNMWTNFTDNNVKAWGAVWGNLYLNGNPQYDGLFLDDSSASSFLNVLEPSADYSLDYGKCLATIWRTAAPGPLGQRFLVLNMGPDTVTEVNEACPAAWRETQITEVNGWSHFVSHLNTIARVAAQFSPSPIQLVDSDYTAGNSTTAPNDRTKLLVLSAYYCLATPQTYFVPFADNYYNTSSPPASRGPDVNIFPNRWIQALTVDIGQPTAASYVIATGTDPSPLAGGRTYKVWARDFDNALVLYKPMSDNGGGSINTDTSSASNTTVTLPAGNYYQLNADSSPGTSTTGTVALANGQGMILIKTS